MEPYRRYTFGQWVKQGCPVHWTVQNATDWVAIGASPLLQWNFIKDAKSRVVLGQIESFESDLKRIITHLNTRCLVKGVPHRFAYRPVRVNTSDHTQCSYTPETWDLISDLFREDFVRFGYPMRRAS